MQYSSLHDGPFQDRPSAVVKAMRLLSTNPSATRERRARLDHAREGDRWHGCSCYDSSTMTGHVEWDNPECALYHFRGLDA